jgi:hypothetical protein
MDVGVPAGDALFDVSRVVRHWIDADILKHDHCTATPDNAEKDVVRFGSLERDVKPETVAVKRQRGGDIIHDEERRNTGDSWFSHVSICTFNPSTLLPAAYRFTVLQMTIEKIQDRFVGTDLVGFLRKAMAFVIKQDVFDHAVSLLDVVDDLV